MKFNEIYLDNFSNFDKFKMEFHNIENDKTNINLLVGRNGSGKSTFLDALFEIGRNNLDIETDRYTKFSYQIRENKKIYLSKMENEETIQNKKWNKVIRYHTGHTQRTSTTDLDPASVLCIDQELTKWCLPALILCGAWSNPNIGPIWKKILNLVLGYDEDEVYRSKQLNPKILWLELPASDDSFINFIDGSTPDYSIPYGDNKRYYWKIENLKNKANPFNTLKRIIGDSESGSLIDCGFLYSYNKNSNDLFPDQYLSDGEHAFLNRMAMLQILALCDCTERYLILLDEPETHFNEHWKTYFLYLISEMFKDNHSQNCKLATCKNRKCNHDIFISTHSAMLVTDAKQDEVHRMENRETGFISWPTPIKTFGVNIVDIGKALFQMESDIGKRSQTEITKTINDGLESRKTEQLEKMLREVGPGEWRWKIRTAIKEIEQGNRYGNFEKKEK